MKREDEGDVGRMEREGGRRVEEGGDAGRVEREGGEGGWKREGGRGRVRVMYSYRSPAYVRKSLHVATHMQVHSVASRHARTHLHNVWVCDPSQQGNLSGHNSHLLVLHPAIGEDARLAEELYHNLDVGQDEGKRDAHLRTSRHKKGGEKVEGRARSRAARSCTSQL